LQNDDSFVFVNKSPASPIQEVEKLDESGDK
jgi:hypothetical protein